MSGFERYPGPPADERDLYRVISPWRDAIAWVSIADRLRVAQYLVRQAAGGWRSAFPAMAQGEPEESLGDPVWTLQVRDPVELSFVTISPTVKGSASVTIDREGCVILVELRNGGTAPIDLVDVVSCEGGELSRLDAIQPRTTLQPGEHAAFQIRIPAG